MEKLNAKEFWAQNTMETASTATEQEMRKETKNEKEKYAHKYSIRREKKNKM